MKKTILTFLSVLFCAITFAQNVPQGINYQAIARDAAGAELANDTLIVQFSVLEGAAISWQEIDTVTTNEFGLFTTIIGGGTSTSNGSSSTFDLVDWGVAAHSLKVEIDYGNGYLDMGTTDFMSVPYSLHAKTAANGSTTDELQTLTISGDTIFLIGGGLDSNFIILPALLGCTYSTATNYNALANTDDGSCIIYGCTDSIASNYNALANTDDGSCIYPPCNGLDTFSWNSYCTPNYGFWSGSSSSVKIDWSNMPNPNCRMAYYTRTTDPNTLGNTWSPYPINWDNTGLLYNNSQPNTTYYFLGMLADSSLTDTLVITTADCIPGCTDSTATNYNSLANTDDGLCCFDNLVSFTTSLTSGTTSYAWSNNGLSWSVNEIGDTTVLGVGSVSYTNGIVNEWAGDAADICLVEGCYEFVATDFYNYAASFPVGFTIDGVSYTGLAGTFGVGSVTWDDGSCVAVVNGCTDSTAYSGYNPLANTDDGSCIAVVNGCTDSTATNYNASANTDDGSCIAVVNGCTDPTATNYNASANTDDGSCIAVVNGCTDSTATNYNAAANTDDGSCTYPCLLDEVVLTMTDSYGDGWNGGTLTIDGVTYDQPTTAPFGTGGASDTYTLCVDLSTCIAVTYSAGSYSNENSWSISDASGAVLASGGNVSGQFGSCIGIIYGCTDSTATNYNAAANTDDGSCIAVVNGCTDPTAFNYDPLANTDDGSCMVIGNTFQGGIIFWLDGNGGGLIAAPSNQDFYAEWGCDGYAIVGADGTAIGTGNQNTIDIEAGCSSSGTAADICANLTIGGYSDWFLPSRNELNEMYLNIGQGNALGLGNIGGFANGTYWSSTEGGTNYAWGQYFGDGYQYDDNKSSTNNVRAVRAF